MKIIGLWVSKYFSGSTDERFLKPLQNLGHEVLIVNLEDPGVEGRLLKAIETFKPDVILHVPYPNSIRKEVLKNISFNSEIVTICWNGDDEWAWDAAEGSFHPSELCKVHNWVVTTDPKAVERYAKLDFKRVILKSWGYSSQDWSKKKVKKEIDVYFCGQKTPERDYFLRGLRDQDIKVIIHGAGYSDPILLSDMIENYRRARIGINFVTGKKKEFVYQQMKARNFEIPAAGTFILTENLPDLKEYFKPGFHLDTFSSPSQMINKVKFYLKNENIREQMAVRAQERVRRYSYETIFKDVLSLTKLRKKK